MKRIATPFVLLGLAALAVPALLADAKTTQKTLTRLEGMMGTAASMFAGSAYNDGVTTTVAVKGNRMANIGSSGGQIIDMTEQKAYVLNGRSKDYTVMTFEQLRAQMAQMRDQMAKQNEQMKGRQGPTPTPQPTQKPGTEMTADMDVKETGQHKQIGGYDAREVVITVTSHEKGKTIAQSGGMIATVHNWIAPPVAPIDEIRAFEMKFWKAAYGDEFAGDVQQAMQASAMYPGLQSMMERVSQESQKLQGTSLSSSTTIESMFSDEQFKQMEAENKKNQNSNKGNDGGFGAMLAAKMGAGGPTKQRNGIMTVSREYLTIEKVATAADVAIPAGYTLKK